MILQALYDYAQRKGNELPEEGFENIPIKYLIKIREDGSLVDLVSTEGEDKKAHIFEKLPMRVARSGKTPIPSLLLDNTEYVISDNNKRESFVKQIEALPEEIKKTKEINAVILFYRNNHENGIDKISICNLWERCQKENGIISFVLQGSDSIVPQLEIIREYQRKKTAEKIEGTGDPEKEMVKEICLITGKKEVISRLHAATFIIGAKSNAKLVSFQKSSGYDSYGREQSYNAPVSVRAESAYTKALNYLTRSKENKFRLGDDTIVFWAEKAEAASFESSFSAFFTTDFDDPDRNTREVKNLFSAPYTAKLESVDSDFYVLGLSPNSARISVRFWETGQVSRFAERIRQHFSDFEIIKSPNEPEYLNLHRILTSIALERKIENIAPNLEGNMIQSILKGIPYPITLQQQCIRRIRTEQKVTRERAAILKAYINRLNRYKNNDEEVSVALDRACLNKGYLLGRLFAVFEKIQQDTHPGLNATITDRFYGAASTNPTTVFTQLMRLNRHHMSSYENQGLKITREKEIGEIMNALDSFPNHLDLTGQSYFALGYYHERQSFYSSSNKSENTEGDK